MTPTGKPDDDHEVERPEPGQPAQPPPPQWLDDQQGPTGPLLPEFDDDEDEPERAAASTGGSEGGVPEGESPADEASDSGSEPDETRHTVVMESRPAAPSAGGSNEETPDEDAAQPPATAPATAPAAGRPPSAVAPPATSTDIPAPPPFPYAEEMSDATRVEQPTPPPLPSTQPSLDATRVEPLPSHQPPAPPRPAPGHPPATPSQSPPAHEPFPYAQEIPAAPAAPEPFPYAQEIPGTPPGAAAPEPSPWVQQIPDAGPPGANPVPPLAPPPVIEEPWRTHVGPTRPRRSLKKPLLIGVAVLAVAGLAAAGVLVVPGLFEGEDEGDKVEGAKLAASMFPVGGTARTDGRDQQITDVAAVGSTVVAVGGETDPQGARGLFLTSGDGGRTFRSATQQGTDGGVAPSGGVPSAVGGSSRGWVAIGSGTEFSGAVWTSENGTEWRRQPDAVGDVFGKGNRVQRIVATDSGYFAIGENSKNGQFTDSAPAVWLSGDGRRWEARVGDQIGVRVNNGTISLVEAAASGDVILLEGLVTPKSGKQGPYRLVWRSEDGGRTWSTSDVPVPKGSRGLVVGGGEPGFLAVREIKSGGKLYGQAYTSKDGRSWTAAGALRTSGYLRTHRVVGDTNGYVAVIVRDRDMLLSRSADGAAWKAAGMAESKPGLEITGTAAAGGRSVLVGREPGGGDMDPMLGVWDAAGAAVPVDLTKIAGVIRPDHSVRSVGATGDLAVAVGSAHGDAAAWSSPDGSSWKPAQGLGAAFTRPGPQQLTDVTGGASGWLAVGYDQAAPRRPLVVTSRDGATWEAADSAAVFAGDKEGIPITYAAAAGNGSYVIVGTQGHSAAIWATKDLARWARGTGVDPSMLQGNKNAPRWILDVTAGPFGYAAVGGSHEAQGNRPSVWASSDGRKWALQLLELPAGVTAGHLTHVAAQGNTLVATGIAATQQGLNWLGYVSTDAGKTWKPLNSPSGDTIVSVTALAASTKGFAATGTTGPVGATDVVSWTSPDGLSWTTATPGGTGLGGAGHQEVTGLAAFKGTLLGVGRSADANGDQPVLWSRAG
ncbi:hypothetical protein BZB76_5620 [Actinomadura pelletieri DSM 43383]|uniref:Uncharacterized protein n=1 Tax=Actinomadura pelletieri DSM 43383 TaxID=1120940 RepID=A0A495QGX0_9ACTN|nr:hypothetical protein [Actinomadura pelletieri]RKS71134.1 hypothetical protein BZB76_5620 [Actinomadura pelletieri DSM 43383]